MDRVEQLKLCKICSNQKLDFEKGIICGLTNNFPDFEGTCSLFLEDLQLKNKQEKLDYAHKKPKANKLAIAGFILGILSIFFAWIGIVPIAGIVVSIIALIKFDPKTDDYKWMAIAGLVLSLIYFIIYLNTTGHIKF